LAGRDVVEALDFAAARCLEQRLRSEHVRPEEPSRVDDRERVVRLGGEVDDDVDLLVAQRLLDELEVADVAVNERNLIREAVAISGVREEVERDDVIVRPALEPVADEVRADEPGAACHEQSHRRQSTQAGIATEAGEFSVKGMWICRSVRYPQCSPAAASGRSRGCAPGPGACAMDVTKLAATILAALGLAGSAPAGHVYHETKRPAAHRTHRGQSLASIFVAGHGWGHGIGLAQYGAYGYALHGWTYDKIVAHYYPGTTLGKSDLNRVRVLLAPQAK